MRLYLAFILVFLIYIVFSEFMTDRKDIIGMHSNLNDVLVSCGLNANVDIYESKTDSRVEVGNFRDLCLYLKTDKNSNKRKMMKESIELISRALSYDSISRYSFIRESMMNHAIVSGYV